MNIELEEAYKHALKTGIAVKRAIERIENARKQPTFIHDTTDVICPVLTAQQEIMYTLVNLLKALDIDVYDENAGLK
jgi:hypothetical protein